MKGEKNRLNKLRHELRMWLTELLYYVFKRFEIFENFFYCQNSGKTSKSFSYNRDQYLINTKFMNRDEVEIHKKNGKERDLALIKSVIICFTM